MGTKPESRVKNIVKSQHFPMIALLAITIAVFSIMSGATFLTMINLKNILNSMVVTAMLTVGAGCIMISGQIDFSAGYVGTMTGVIIATLVTNIGWPLYFALPLAMVVAAAVGVLNASLVHLLNFQAFIATLATGLVCKGMALVIGLGKTIPYKEPVLNYLGTGKIYSFFPVAIFIALFVFIVYGILISKTTFGRSVFSDRRESSGLSSGRSEASKNIVHTVYKQCYFKRYSWMFSDGTHKVSIRNRYQFADIRGYYCGYFGRCFFRWWLGRHGRRFSRTAYHQHL